METQEELLDIADQGARISISYNPVLMLWRISIGIEFEETIRAEGTDYHFTMIEAIKKFNNR